jgi:hypothetical protein
MMHKTIRLIEKTTRQCCDANGALEDLRAAFKERKLPFVPMGANNSKTQLPGFYRRAGDTCPHSCGYRHNGCYAAYGYLGAITRGADPSIEATVNSFLACSLISLKLCKRPARVTVSGDFCKDGVPDLPLIDAVCEASETVRGVCKVKVTAYGYTHMQDLGLIQKMRDSGIFILRSDYPGIGGAVVWAHDDIPSLQGLYPGTKFVKCAHAVRGTPCRRCNLCADSIKRKHCIVLPPHGAAHNKAQAQSQLILSGG